MTNSVTFIKQERLYAILTKVIIKLSDEAGMKREDIIDMLDITENEIRDLSTNKGRLN
jgi:hypothetical protein